MTLGTPRYKPARRWHMSDGCFPLTRGNNWHSYPSCASEQSSSVLLSPIQGRGNKRRLKHHSPHSDLAANRGCLVIHSAAEKAQKFGTKLARNGMFSLRQIEKMSSNAKRHSLAEISPRMTSTLRHLAKLGFTMKVILKRSPQATQSTGKPSLPPKLTSQISSSHVS